jgi:hypothetical protein
MMLIKLDDGSFINLEFITGIYPLTKPQSDRAYSVTMLMDDGDCVQYISSADCDRVVTAMGGVTEVTNHD